MAQDDDEYPSDKTKSGIENWIKPLIYLTQNIKLNDLDLFFILLRRNPKFIFKRS